MYQTDQDRIFGTVAEKYLAANEAGWTAKNSRHNRQLLQDHVYPAIGYRILLSLSEAEYLAILARLLEGRKERDCPPAADSHPAHP